MLRYVNANKAIEILRRYRDSEARDRHGQGVNCEIELVCWVLSNNKILPNIMIYFG